MDFEEDQSSEWDLLSNGSSTFSEVSSLRGLTCYYLRSFKDSNSKSSLSTLNESLTNDKFRNKRTKERKYSCFMLNGGYRETSSRRKPAGKTHLKNPDLEPQLSNKLKASFSIHVCRTIRTAGVGNCASNIPFEPKAAM